jgi:hypothetical protein
MIEVTYRREVPFPRTRVLSQYFDLEHLEHVHPRSFGRARMVSQRGERIVWELEWPRVLGILGFRSLFRQQYVPAWGIRAVITGGLLRGSETEVRLEETERGHLGRGVAPHRGPSLKGTARFGAASLDSPARSHMGRGPARRCMPWWLAGRTGVGSQALVVHRCT